METDQGAKNELCFRENLVQHDVGLVLPPGVAHREPDLVHLADLLHAPRTLGQRRQVQNGRKGQKVLDDQVLGNVVDGGLFGHAIIVC